MQAIHVMHSDMNNVEKVAFKTGFGLYHKFLVILAALSSFSEGLVLTTLLLAIPLMACDLPLTENMMVSVSVVYTIGEAVGGFVFLALGDIFGKKSLVPILSALVFASTLSSSFVHGYLFLSFFAMFLGSALATNTTLMRINLAENMPLRTRGIILVMLDFAWTFGYILSVVSAWTFSPLALKFYSKDARFFTWRVMIAVSSIFSVILGCMSSLIKPSFRYLLYCKKNKEALNVLKEMYAINTSKNSEEFDVREVNLQGQITDYGIYRNIPMRIYMEHACSLMKTVYRGTCVLTSNVFLLRLVIMAYLKMVTLGGMFVTHMWLYKVANQTSNCYLTKTSILFMEEISMTDGCHLHFSTNAFRDFVLLTPNIVIGQICAIFLIERIKRKYLIAASCIVCGACNVALAFMERQLLVKIGLSSVYLIFYSFGDSVINIVIIEMFPTALRGTAIGEAQFLGKIFCIFIKRYLSMPCSTSMILGGASMIVAAILAFFLPEFKGRSMME